MSLLTATRTQSVGVPSTANVRDDSFRTCSGRRRVREWAAPLCSISGATTHTSLVRLFATCTSTLSPGALIPSSLVTRMRDVRRLSGALSIGLDHLDAAHIGHQRLGQRHGPIGLLVVLQDGDHCPADSEAGAVQRMHEARALLAGLAHARLHPPGLELAAVGTAGDLSIGLLAGQPHLDVVGL